VSGRGCDASEESTYVALDTKAIVIAHALPLVPELGTEIPELTLVRDVPNGDEKARARPQEKAPPTQNGAVLGQRTVEAHGREHQSNDARDGDDWYIMR
jgi:hypothetical protein